MAEPTFDRDDIGPDAVTIEISCAALSLCDDENLNLVQSHRGTIIIKDDIGQPVKVGEMSFDMVDMNAIGKTEAHPLEIFDEIDADTFEMGMALFDPNTYGIRRSVRELGVELVNDYFLHLRELFIEPEWRGRKLGMAAMHIVLKRFSRGCDFAVLCASPIRVDVVSEAARKKQQKALRSLYEQAGFTRLGKSLWMVLDLYECVAARSFPFAACASSQPTQSPLGSGSL
ncbi:hypothetical protein G3A43_06600 [Paraburkholderia aspalathi]|nr:GNAT family N-acetyltransferase [Paraburkholderia aspalathi]MBK3779919.1 hypothetical protein [Paraburkholderia aspalathi]